MNLPLRFDHTFRVEVIIAIVVFGLIMLLLLAAIARSAVRRARPPSQKHEFTKTEASYTAALAVVAAGLVAFSLVQNTSSDPPPKVVVNVTGYQWCWRFAYGGTHVSVTANCVDGHIPTLVVPTGEVIRFNVTSADVVHAFWVPHLRFKTFAYPNFTNTFETTIASPGNWLGECSEFCGLYHYAMHFRVRAETPAQFASWLHQQGSAAR
ncbi:MAG TPA: cytochrome c oxidase subunit II [Acidimicrobiales bacterium]|nr:cytochrome c oxidase subunit II [Acidimicrobiales bacterium]